MPDIENGRPAVGGSRRKLLLGLVAVAAVYGLIGRWQHLVDIPRWQVGVYGMIARNYVKYGFEDCGLAQISSPGPTLPRGERVQYQNHPPLTPLLSALSVAAFGPQTWAVRLPHLVCGVALVLVLGALAARACGGTSGAWCVVLAAAVPIAVRYGGAFVDVLGPALLLWTSLASLAYLRYCESGRGQDYCLLLAACVLGLLTDWPAYVLCFALAAHAVVYRSAARRLAMAVLPALAVACFGVFVLYARSVPKEGHLLQTFGEAFSGWAAGGDAPEVGRIAAKAWALDFAGKFLIWLSPLSLLAALWLVRRAKAAAWTREHRRDQHVLLLWAWPLPYVVAFPSIFYVHPYYHLLFLPAVAVSAAAVADRFYRGGGRLWRGAVAVAGVGFLLMASVYAMTQEDRWEPLRHRQVAWAAELARRTAFGQESAFALHYAQQMRFVADRAVLEYADTQEKVEALRARAPRPVGRLFVPLAYPFGDAAFGAGLASRFPVRASGLLALVELAAPQPAAEVAVRRHGGAALEGGARLEELVYAVVPGADGPPLVCLGPTVSGLPKARPEDAVEWRVSFVRGDGAPLGAIAMPAQESASYFLEAPRAWSPADGRIEVALRHRSTDAAAVGRVQRLVRLALRFLTFRALGNPKPVVRSLGKVELALR